MLCMWLGFGYILKLYVMLLSPDRIVEFLSFPSVGVFFVFNILYDMLFIYIYSARLYLDIMKNIQTGEEDLDSFTSIILFR